MSGQARASIVVTIMLMYLSYELYKLRKEDKEKQTHKDKQ